jgi:FkbM family methyltransferase
MRQTARLDEDLSGLRLSVRARIPATMVDRIRRLGRWLRANPALRRVYDAAGLLLQAGLGRVVSGPARGLHFKGGGHAGYVLGLSERAVQDALVANLRPGGVFWDVGAHAGFLSILGARLAGPGGRVVCFEPVPANVAELRANIDANGFGERVEICELALTDADGTGHMSVEAGITASLGNGRGDGLEVVLARGDSLDAPAPTVVKIDVEGAECSVLEGMRRLLDEHHPVLIVEIHQGNGPRVREQLERHGYRVEQLADAGGMPHLLARA